MTILTPATPTADWLQALHSSNSAWLVTDEQLRVAHVNEGFTRLLGYSLQDMQDAWPLEKLLGQDTELAPHIRDELEQHGAYTGELLLRCKDGSPLWVAATVNTLNRQPFPKVGTTAEVIVLTDIGFTKRFEALQRQMLEDVVMEKPLANLLHDMCGTLEQMIPRLKVCVMDVDASGLLNPLAAPSIAPQVLELMKCVRSGPDHGASASAAYLGHEVMTPDIAEDAHWGAVATLFTSAGLQACWSNPIKNHEGRVVGTLDFYFDTPRSPNELHRQLVLACLHLCAVAMERDASKHRIRQLAYYDTLTRLPNRTMFNECAEQALHAMRGHQGLVFFLDLDRFKLWNDSLGHAAGDALLREIADRLGSCTRPEDVVGRLSSDEFAVLMPHCAPDQMPFLAQRMLDAIAEPFSINGVMTTPNACVGVCTYPEDGTDIETLLRHADQAMYAAKGQGSQRWERYRPEMGKISQERADMERELRTTLAAGGLQLHYQPQICSSGAQRLYGVEALARWQHPEWGWVPPPRFIAVAEDSGLIHTLTSWLIDAACTQLATWRAQGVPMPHVSINLSTNNFHLPDFAMQVQQTLLRHGLTGQDLMLEITESVMLDSSPATLNNLQTLHAMGMRLSMDDFGTGYSSLSYLHRLPISELKLDKSFVQDVTVSSAASALTRSVLNIATSLGMTVVAEGVETQEQADWLARHGCPVLQGYRFAKPMPATDIGPWVQQHAERHAAAPLSHPND